MSQQFFNQLNKHKLTPNQYSVLWHCKNKIRCTLPNAEGEARILQINGFLDDNHALTPKGEEVLLVAGEAFKKTKTKNSVEVLGDDWTEQIDIYRKKFPVGKKGDAHGVRDKFVQFFMKNPDITWEIIQKATNLYHSEDPGTYCMQADNFIQVMRDGALKCKLLELCERVLDGHQVDDSDSIYDAA